jgi:hypothetical protein
MSFSLFPEAKLERLCEHKGDVQCGVTFSHTFKHIINKKISTREEPSESHQPFIPKYAFKLRPKTVYQQYGEKLSIPYIHVRNMETPLGFPTEAEAL